MKTIRQDSWPLGANNVAKPNRLPEGAVRDSVNLDPSAEGLFSLRAGFERVLEGSDIRHATAVGDRIVFVDGLAVRAYDTATDEVFELGALRSLAGIASTVLNGQVYMCSMTDSLRTDGVTLSQWGVTAPGFTLEIIEGHLPAGIYKFGVTALGDSGEESGTEPVIVTLPEGAGVRLLTDDARPLRAYASVANGSTLYYQGLLIGSQAFTRVTDDTERLTTAGLVPLPCCDELVAFHSVILGRVGKYVFHTDPMHPHLMDPVSGFFQYGSEPTVLAATDGGVFVVADRTYFLTGLETAPQQRMVLDMGAVEGSAVALPDGRAAWFTRYGQAIGTPAGEVLLPNRRTYAPDLAALGAAGVLDHAGNQMIVTTMRGATHPNNLATGDFADLEI